MFGDGSEPDSPAPTEQEFVALCLHTMQQLGGELYHKGNRVQATDISQTAGDPGCLRGEFLYGDRQVNVASLFPNS